ncbi:MAG: tetratricopeptide repeat protein [Bacteroidaceae bacterium]|nr:tetratricopeptide repeat protein [Bacteroidaceae bacterium]
MLRRFTLTLLLCLGTLAGSAQYNVQHVILNGRSAMYYKDYILAIQYFTRAAEAKPYLYEPWYYRAIAKFNLDDYAGTADDCSRAIELCPYVSKMYELRALAYIRQHLFDKAIADYDVALRMEPGEQNMWFNRTLCRVELKDYAQASLDLDTIIARWNTFAPAYAIRAEIAMQQGDTTAGAEQLDRSLQLDPYNLQAWKIRAAISLSRAQWKEADEQLSQAIHLQPTNVGNYVNRALARLNLNNLRGAMDDYDRTIDLDSTNFLAHFNRGLLRVQVGDYNRAVDDFDFIISREPENYIAIYNRATLLQRIGNLRRAIDDYSRVIRAFPNFWVGLHNRAECYRALGMTQLAAADEARILHAQLNKHFSGVQPRWTAAQRRQTRKKNEIDLSKYDQIVVEDEPVVELEYANTYRGRVQDRPTDAQPMPLYTLITRPYSNNLTASAAFEPIVENYNQAHHPRRTLCVGCNAPPLDANAANLLLTLLDSLNNTPSTDTQAMRMQRAILHADVQDYTSALTDLDAFLQTDSTSALAWWHHATCLLQRDKTNAQTSTQQQQLQLLQPLSELRRALTLAPDSPFLHYNIGCLLMQQGKYEEATTSFTQALQHNDIIAEAYYNRALCHKQLANTTAARNDLSRAGQLGLHQAYSMMKTIKE